MSTPVTIIGTIATDPHFIQTAGKVPFCSFRIASNERRYDRERSEWVDGDTNWFSVHAFRTLAEHARESFKKGDRVFVHGRLRIRQWEKEERSGTSIDVEADSLGHDIRWGVSRFTKRYGAELSETQAPGGTASPGTAAAGAARFGAADTGAAATDSTSPGTGAEPEAAASADPASIGWTAASTGERAAA